jgi:hypothetical protein
MCDKSLDQELDLKNDIFEDQIVVNEGNLKFDKRVDSTYEDYGIGIDSDLSESKFPKNSINRFGDTLMEDILSYLSFRDKVVFESVSKQWKKVIYNKQTELRLNSYEIEGKHTLNKLLQSFSASDFPSGFAHQLGFKAINKESFESLLKKCKSIKTFKIECYTDSSDLELIGKYCPNLENLELSVFGLNEKTLSEFGLKYGNQLKRLRIYYPIFCGKFVEKFINNCENLLEFNIDDNLTIIKEDINHLPKLKTLKALGVCSENLPKLEIIAQKYNKTLSEIELYFYLTSDEILSALSYTSLLKNLKVLRMNFSLSDEKLRTIDLNIIKIGKSCTEINELYIDVSSFELLSKSFFYAFNHFRALKKLNLYLYDINTTFDGSVECFKNLNLKYLQISYKQLSDQFFENIHIFLPNLVKIVINSEAELTDRTIYSLSKLKNLRSLKFLQNLFSYRYITDDSIKELLDSCPMIENIAFNSRLNITNKTIDHLIVTALKNSRKTINFCCTGNEAEFADIDVNNFINKLPQNLIIDL